MFKVIISFIRGEREFSLPAFHIYPVTRFFFTRSKRELIRVPRYRFKHRVLFKEPSSTFTFSPPCSFPFLFFLSLSLARNSFPETSSLRWCQKIPVLSSLKPREHPFAFYNINPHRSFPQSLNTAIWRRKHGSLAREF